MSISFLPTARVADLTQITVEKLHKHGIETLFLDFDNTIVPYSTNNPTAPMEGWLREMAESDIFLCVVSNSHKDRVKIFCDCYGIPCVTHASKPSNKGICNALGTYGRNRKTTALAGDQIFTDVLGGNLAGLMTILVKPIALSNIWLALRHGIEQPFLWCAKNRTL